MLFTVQLEALRARLLMSTLLLLARTKKDSGIVMVDGTFLGDSFEQDRSWDDSGMTISGI